VDDRCSRSRWCCSSPLRRNMRKTESERWRPVMSPLPIDVFFLSSNCKFISIEKQNCFYCPRLHIRKGYSSSHTFT
jgi:hypothetical protein